jgi:hypothetical protein
MIARLFLTEYKGDTATGEYIIQIAIGKTKAGDENIAFYCRNEKEFDLLTEDADAFFYKGFANGDYCVLDDVEFVPEQKGANGKIRQI